MGIHLQVMNLFNIPTLRDGQLYILIMVLFLLHINVQVNVIFQLLICALDSSPSFRITKISSRSFPHEMLSSQEIIINQETSN